MTHMISVRVAAIGLTLLAAACSHDTTTPPSTPSTTTTTTTPVTTPTTSEPFAPTLAAGGAASIHSTSRQREVNVTLNAVGGTGVPATVQLGLASARRRVSIADDQHGHGRGRQPAAHRHLRPWIVLCPGLRRRQPVGACRLQGHDRALLIRRRRLTCGRRSPCRQSGRRRSRRRRPPRSRCRPRASR